MPDVTFVLMAPPAAAIAPAALPLLSSVLLIATPRELRVYRPAPHPETPATGAARTKSPAATIRRTLGISVATVCSLALVMVGLGYMQHHISFAPLSGFAQVGNAAALQIVRGVAAIALFCVMLLFPRRGQVAYRVGLLAIVAGFSLMPLLYGSRAFWVSGAVILAGYTTFDVLAWVIVAQAVYAGLGSAQRIVCAVQMLVRSAFCSLGGLLGIALNDVAQTAAFAYADAIFIGYLMTIAVVLILSGRDVWELFDARPVPEPGTQAPAADTLAERTAQLARAWGLTEREAEVFGLLVIGRTQPWIAERLGISESTVNSHVRHIYSKSNVNSRQGLLDLVFAEQPAAQSPESVDMPL